MPRRVTPTANPCSGVVESLQHRGDSIDGVTTCTDVGTRSYADGGRRGFAKVITTVTTGGFRHC